MEIKTSKTIISIEITDEEFSELSLKELTEKAREEIKKNNLEGDISIYVSTKKTALEVKIEA